MSEGIMLVDLSGLYWSTYFAMGDPLDAYSKVYDKLTRLQERYAVIACGDSPTCFRKDIDPEYKAQRKPDTRPPSAWDGLKQLAVQLPEAGIPIVAVDTYEADDIIATLTARAGEARVMLMTTDKDMIPLLVRPDTAMVNYSGLVRNADDIADKWGVHPDRFLELLALTGDSADNVQGCPGVGLKKAVALLTEFESLEEIPNGLRMGIKIPGIGPKLVESIPQWDPTRTLELLRLIDSVELNHVAAFTAAEQGHLQRQDDEDEYDDASFISNPTVSGEVAFNEL